MSWKGWDALTINGLNDELDEVHELLRDLRARLVALGEPEDSDLIARIDDALYD